MTTLAIASADHDVVVESREARWLGASEAKST